VGGEHHTGACCTVGFASRVTFGLQGLSASSASLFPPYKHVGNHQASRCAADLRGGDHHAAPVFEDSLFNDLSGSTDHESSVPAVSRFSQLTASFLRL
jgi:hypothetical protein